MVKRIIAAPFTIIGLVFFGIGLSIRFGFDRAVTIIEAGGVIAKEFKKEENA